MQSHYEGRIPTIIAVRRVTGGPPSDIKTLTTQDTPLGASMERYSKMVLYAPSYALGTLFAANTDKVLIGDQSSQNFPLQPGDTITLEDVSPAEVWAKAFAGSQTLIWICFGQPLYEESYSPYTQTDRMTLNARMEQEE